MYGNERLPRIEISESYRAYEGSIWRGYPEATWFKVVKVNGEVKRGTIVKESSGVYSPFTVEDIVSSVTGLPGARLGIVADKKATGTTENSATVLIGIQGQVDKSKIFVGETAFTELTDEQKINLNTQLEAWNFQLVDVM